MIRTNPEISNRGFDRLVSRLAGKVNYGCPQRFPTFGILKFNISQLCNTENQAIRASQYLKFLQGPARREANGVRDLVIQTPEKSPLCNTFIF